MKFYSNSDRSKLIATNQTICSVITRSSICQNICTYTIPYNKGDDEQLDEIDEQSFKEAYDCVTAFMADLFIQPTGGKGVGALLTDYKK